MFGRILGWIGVVVLTLSFVSLLGGIIPVGPIPKLFSDVFDFAFVDALLFIFKNVLNFKLSQSETKDILLGFALFGVVYSALCRKKGDQFPKRGWLRVPLAGYAVFVLVLTFIVHFVSNDLTENYAAECVKETTADWSLAQVWHLFTASNYEIDHCQIHERQTYVPAPGGFMSSVEFFVQYLGSTIVLFVIPPVVIIAFFLRRLDINQIMLKNFGAILTALGIVFGLGQIDWRDRSKDLDRPDINAQVEAGNSFKDCQDCPELVIIPGGTSMMGSPIGDNMVPENQQLDDKGRRRDAEWPQHSVNVAPFAVGRFEVTWGNWKACVQEGACFDIENEAKLEFLAEELRFSNGEATHWGLRNHPLIAVSWDEAKTYVNWLSQKTGNSYRLLSEAEWEYVARAGTDTRYHFGNDPEMICGYANIADQTYWNHRCQNSSYVCGDEVRQSCTDGHVNTAPVGSFPPNAFGVFDLIGNVSELTEDCYRSRYFGAPSDGSSIVTGDCTRRVIRGGSMDMHPVFARSAARQWNYSDEKSISRGFRVARDLELSDSR